MPQAKKILTILAMVLIVSCAGSSSELTSGLTSGLMVAVDTVNDSRIIEGSRTEDKIRDSIIEGAVNAGWIPEDLGNNMILATYQIRVHTVNVNIFYSDFSYNVKYKSSIGMKMYCTKQDQDKRKNMKLSGLHKCLYDQAPQYIHRNYDI